MKNFFYVLVSLLAYSHSAPLHSQPQSASAPTLEQLIPAAELAQIRRSLPAVAFNQLEDVLRSEQTLWYTDEVMEPSYQDSVGAASNRTWPDLIAASEEVKSGLFDRSRGRWQFPFATTAGTDNATNLRVVNFVHLPGEDGRIETIRISKVMRNASRYQWTWTYPVGTIFGEVLFVKDGSEILPTEIRTRKRYASGWATNVYRPFPTAADLADAIKARRPDYAASENLLAVMEHLEDPDSLTPKTLAARAALAPTFRQEGWIDTLPAFQDDQLVRELLRETRFVSVYDKPWKENGSQIAYAANSSSGLSIVPNNYDAGLLQVTDEACSRCHQETGRLVSEFYGGLYLYGELWGKDGIFSFHPFDESRYPYLRREGSGPGGMTDNRRINPALSQMNIFAMADELGLTETKIEESPEPLPKPLNPANDELVTYSDHIKPILDNHCAECHTLGPRAIDLTQFPFQSDSNLDQGTIVNIILARAGGSAPSMPPGVRPRLTPGELALIEAWQEGGLQP